jgi:hypothetical protein
MPTNKGTFAKSISNFLRVDVYQCYDHELNVIELDQVEVGRDSQIGNEIDGPFVGVEVKFSQK